MAQFREQTDVFLPSDIDITLEDILEDTEECDEHLGTSPVEHLSSDSEMEDREDEIYYDLSMVFMSPSRVEELSRHVDMSPAMATTGRWA